MNPPHSRNLEELHPPFPPRDVLDFADRDHPGVAMLRSAVRSLDSGDAVDAAAAAREARRIGVPAELVPYRAIVHGIALVLVGRAEEAEEELSSAWSSHPDVAALPAALGAARLERGDTTGAARAMFASVVSDDPDHSLAIHRRRLTLLLTRVRGASGA